MSKWKDYNIDFKGLKDGNHRFEYQIDASFFELIDGTLYNNGSIHLVVDMKKSPQMLVLDYIFKGTLETVCDNCLETMDEPVDFKYQTFVKFADEAQEVDDEDVVVISRDETEYNIGSTVYDLIVTSQPIRHIHPLNENGVSLCNPDMIEKLSNYLVDEQSNKKSAAEVEEIDPRWNELKKLLDKNNN